MMRLTVGAMSGKNLKTTKGASSSLVFLFDDVNREF